MRNFNRNVIISGASGGIGMAISQELLDRGYKVILLANEHFENIEKFKRKNEAKKGMIDLYKLDLREEREVSDLVKRIVDKDKDIYGLINSAGISFFKLFQDISLDDWHRVMSINLDSYFLLTSKVLPHMIKVHEGSIVNISSIWGLEGASMETAYSASKGAINSMTMALAKELGPSNIRVNSIAPGLIDTKMNDNLSREDLENLMEEIPLQRMGQPKEVAYLASFLLSDQASYITGQVISLDGGWHI